MANFHVAVPGVKELSRQNDAPLNAASVFQQAADLAVQTLQNVHAADTDEVVQSVFLS